MPDPNDVVIGGRNISKELNPLGGQSLGANSASTRPPQAHISSITGAKVPELKGSINVRQPSRGELAKKRLTDVGKSTWTTVIEPAIRGMMWGALLSIASGLFFKDKKPPIPPTSYGGSWNSGYPTSYTPPWRQEPYQAYWAQPQVYDWQKSKTPQPSGRTPAYINPRDVQFTNEDDAHNVLFSLIDIIAKDGVATVGQFREMVRQVPDYTDYNYGWRSLEGTAVRNFGGYFVIDFPPTSVV